MGAKPHIDIAERRARLGRRHHLASSARAATPLEVTRDLVALHSTDPVTVYLSAAARLHTPTLEAIEAALYEERVLLRMLGMRRTVFVVPTDLAPVVQAACTRAIALQERRRTEQLFAEAGLAADVPTWLAELENATFEALRKRGQATAQELGQDVPDLRQQILMAAGKSYAAMQGISTRVLMQLAADGRIVRGRPRGSWTSTQYRWAPIDAWLTGGLAPLAPGVAQVELVGAWLRSFGPGTLADLKWWTGLTVGEVKRALESLDVLEVDLGEGSGLVLADDLASTPAESWVSLLPALDPTPMGYAERDWFLGDYTHALFDRSGNIGPTVWCDGRIVGGWAQRKNGAIAFKLLEEIGHEAEQHVQAAAQRVAEWLGPVRVTPRFRTPLERELSG